MKTLITWGFFLLAAYTHTCLPLRPEGAGRMGVAVVRVYEGA